MVKELGGGRQLRDERFRSKERLIPARPGVHAVKEATRKREVPEARGAEAAKAIEQWREQIKRAEAMREMVRRATEKLDEVQKRQPRTREEADRITKEYRQLHETIFRFQIAFGHAYRKALDIEQAFNEGKPSVQARYAMDVKSDMPDQPPKYQAGEPMLDRDGQQIMITPFDVLHVAYVEETADFHSFVRNWEELGLVEAAIASYESPVSEFTDSTDRSDRGMTRSALAEGTAAYAFSAGTDGTPPPSLAELAEQFIPAPGEEGPDSIFENALLDLGRYMSPEEAAAMAPALQAVMHGQEVVPANVARFLEQVAEETEEDDPIPTDPVELKRWQARRRQEGRQAKIREYHRSSFDELQARRDSLADQVRKLWARPEMRARWTEQVFQRLILDAKAGEDVLTTPQVRRVASKLRRWEREHPNSIVGAALVGPPGTGKSTGIEHYLETMGRPEPVRMDMSQELTRYALFGSPEVQFESDIDRYRKLGERVKGLTEADVADMVKNHADKLGEALSGMGSEERTVAALASLREEIDEVMKGGAELGTDAHASLQALRSGLEALAQGEYRSELANQLAHITKKNGWRDGMIIYALRNERPLIIDEFNAAKSWTLINKLLTTKPGTDYFFADNNESIPVPDWYRVYFTGNIGAQYGRFKAQPDLVSRLGKRVIEVDYEEPQDEFMVLVAFICNAYGEILRSKDDLYKLSKFVKDVVPTLRQMMNTSKQSSNPISFRTYREVGETLVTPGPAGSPRTTNSVDRAIFESVVNPFAAWEDRTLVKDIIKAMVKSDLLIDDESLWGDIEQWGGPIHDELKDQRDKVDRELRGKAADQLLGGAKAGFAARMMAQGPGL